MPVDPVSAGPGSPTTAKAPATAATTTNAFQGILTTLPQPRQLPAETAVEILNLQILDAAASVGDAPLGGSFCASLGVKEVLARFQEQLSDSAIAKVAAAEAEGGAEGDGGTGAEGGGSAASALEGVILKASRRHGVDAGLIRAVIEAESDFNPRAVSSAGAQGLMQLMPSTARALGVSDPFDPEQNVMAGTRFLKDMLGRYGGNVEEALAAYNWGSGNVDRHGVEQLPRETTAYIEKVKRLYARRAV